MKKFRIALFSVGALGLGGFFVIPLYLLSKYAPSGSPPWWKFRWGVFSAEWVASGLKQDPIHDISVPIWAAVIGGLILIVIELIKEIRSPREEEKSSVQDQGCGFPFIIYSTGRASDVEALKTRFLQQHASLAYQPRFAFARQKTFESRLDVPHLLLTGRTGLGKTRECIQLFLRLSTQKNEEFTILTPHDDFDRPSSHDIPPDFSPRNLILFIDDIHRLCPASRIKTKADLPARSFHDRLASTIQWMNERFAGADLRVVLTCRDDPDLRKRALLDSTDAWSEFSVIQLPGIHRDERQEFIRAIGEHYGLSFETDALEYVARESDGTAFGIIHALAAKSPGPSGAKRVLRLTDVNDYSFCYPNDWITNEYQKKIAPYPARRAVFEALSACQQLGVPTCDFLVTELAARFLRRRWPRWMLLLWLWRTRQYIKHTIQHELRNWMFEYRGEVICPTAYLENKVAISHVAPQVLSSLVQVFREKDHVIRLLPTMGWLSLRVGLDLHFTNEALKLIRLCERHSRTAALLIAKSKLLARLGRDQESQQAAKAACEIDPTDSTALVVLSNAYSCLRKDDLAKRTAQTAVYTAPNSDYAWLNLGVVLSKLGQQDDAIVALAKACDLNPRSARAWYSLGIAYDRKHEFQKSIDACQRATALDPNDGDAWHALGIAYDRAGKGKDAVDALRRATFLEEDDGAIWLSFSRALYSHGQQEEALSALNEAEKRLRVAADYDNLSAVAIAYTKNGRPSDGRRVAEEVISKIPRNIEAQLTLVISLSQLPRCVGEARRARERLGELCATADDWCNLSIAYGRAGQHEQAVDAARKALEIEPENLEAARCLTMDLSQLPDRAEEAQKARERLESLAKSDDDWADLSIAYGRAGEPERAVSAAQKALEIDAENLRAARSLVTNLSQLPDRAEEAQKARERLESLAKSDDDWADLSIAYGRAGEPERAVSAAQKALEIDAENLRAARSLVTNLSQLPDRAEEAQKARERLESLAKSDDDWADLSIAYGRAREPERAVSAAQKALEIDAENLRAARSLVTNLDRLPEHVEEHQKARKQLERLCVTAQDWLKLSTDYGTDGYYQEAVDAADQGIAVDSKNIRLWKSRAMNLDQMANRDPAKRALSAWKRIHDLEASNLGPGAIEPDVALSAVRSAQMSREAWTRLAKIYRAVGRASEAVEIAHETVQESSSVAPYCVAVAEELLNQEPQKVLSLTAYLVGLDRSNKLYRQLQGAALLKTDSPDKAAEAFRELCTNDPADKNSWYALGKAEEKLGQSDKALAAYSKAFEIDPGYKKARNAFERLSKILHARPSTVSSA